LFPVLAAGFPEAQAKVEARDLKNKKRKVIFQVQICSGT
jgi:hypothetical protein